MFDLPFKLFPLALLAGVSIWGLASVLWLQPLVEERMAEKTLIPRCEVNLLKAERAVHVPVDPRASELEILKQILRGTGLDEIPVIDDTIEIIEGQVEATSPKRLRSSKIERDGACSCAVDTAFSDSFYPMALHVASLRTHTPTFMRSLDSTVLAIATSRPCGGLSNAKG